MATTLSITLESAAEVKELAGYMTQYGRVNMVRFGYTRAIVQLYEQIWKERRRELERENDTVTVDLPPNCPVTMEGSIWLKDLNTVGNYLGSIKTAFPPGVKQQSSGIEVDIEIEQTRSESADDTE